MPGATPSLRDVLEQVFAFVAVLDRNGILLEVNRPPLDAAGIAGSDALGKPFWDCHWWSYDANVQTQLRLACAHGADGRASRYDVDLRMAGGRLMSVEFTLKPLPGPTGEIAHLIASAIDITERKRREQELRAASALLKAISEQTSEVLLVKDRAGRILMANPAALALFGSTAALVIGRTDLDLLPDKAQAGAVMDTDRRIMAAGKAEVVEERISKWGEQRIWLSTKTPYRDGAGNVLGIIVVSHDITEREQLLGRVALAASAEERKGAHLEAVFQAMEDGVAVFDMDGNVVLANRAAARIHGLPGTAIKRHYSHLAHTYELIPDDGMALPLAAWPISRVLRGESVASCELRARRKDTGEESVLSLSGEPVRDERGHQVLGVVVVRDVTASRRAERALRESEAHAHELQSALQELKRIDAERQLAADVLEHGEALLVLDGEFRVVLVNEKQEQMSGVPRSKMLGRVIWDVFPEAADPESQYWQEYHRVMRERVPAQFEERYGPRSVWTLVNVYPLHTAAIAIFIRDIASRKRAEEALRQADQQKDAFIAMLSHELRNPLSPIVVATHILQSRNFEDPVSRGALDILVRQSRQMERLLDDLLDVARITRNRLQLQIETFDLAQCIQDAVHSSQELIGDRSHQLELHLPNEPALLRGDPVRLTQVVTNLLNNAAKYCPPRSKIDVGLELAPGAVLLSVRDNGPGIHPDVLPHIFDAFYNAAPPSQAKQGLGIGLWLTHRLVAMHGGRIDVKNTPGAGTHFIVSLPRH